MNLPPLSRVKWMADLLPWAVVSFRPAAGDPLGPGLLYIMMLQRP